MSKNEKTKSEVRKAARLRVKGKAELRNIRMSARKIRIVADKIRNRKVDDALAYLLFQRKYAVNPLISILDSALANAVSRGCDSSKLYIENIQVNKGSIQKRFMPRAQGRSTKIRKQTAHILVSLI